LIGFLDTIGVVPQNFLMPLEYSINTQCQYLLPTTADANGMYLRGELTEERWKEVVKANGHCVPWQESIVKSQEIPISWQDALRIRRLDKLNDDELKAYWKRNGINWDRDHIAYEESYAQYPTIPDLIRMMVRDSFDQTVVDKFEYDTDFDKKWTETAEKWGTAQGITKEIAKNYWRAHWDIPSNTALYEMLHRLRTDDRDRKGEYKDVDVTADDVEQAIRVNDMAPKWVKPLMAISYSPLTRVDVRRMYELNVMDKDEVRRAYRDIGYDATNAERLADFTEVEYGAKRAERQGMLTIKQAMEAYVRREISRDEAQAILQANGVKQERQSVMLDNAQAKINLIDRKTYLAAYRKRFLSGEFTIDQTVARLIQNGMPNDTARESVQRWQLELDAKYKAPTVRMLCKWWTQGLISIDDFSRRCRNIGYSIEDASRIINSCASDQQKRLAAEAKKLAKEAEQRARQAAADAERLRKRLLPCREVKPPCPQPGANGAANGQESS
jgi:hypothetical protein